MKYKIIHNYGAKWPGDRRKHWDFSDERFCSVKSAQKVLDKSDFAYILIKEGYDFKICEISN